MQISILQSHVKPVLINQMETSTIRPPRCYTWIGCLIIVYLISSRKYYKHIVKQTDTWYRIFVPTGTGIMAMFITKVSGGISVRRHKYTLTFCLYAHQSLCLLLNGIGREAANAN